MKRLLFSFAVIVTLFGAVKLTSYAYVPGGSDNMVVVSVDNRPYSDLVIADVTSGIIRMKRRVKFWANSMTNRSVTISKKKTDGTR